MKNETIKMNMRDSVLYAEGRINLGKNGFFINTEFGRIGIEINPFSEVDPLHPVDVLKWEQAPETEWAFQNKSIDADYYVGVNIFGYTTSDHMAVIEAISRVMLFSVGFENPSDNAVQALVMTYMSNYDDTNHTVNTLAAEYIFTHMKKIVQRNNESVKTVVREMFQQKLDSGRDVIEMGSELLSVYISAGNIPVDYFVDKYSEEVFGILLYCHMKQKKSLEGVLQNIVGFNNIKTGNKSTLPHAVNK